MARRCGNCIHKNVCELYDIVQDPTHAVGCGNFLDTADVVPKSEVARKIFEEIEQWLGDYNGCRVITYEKFAELKEKYTGEPK